MEKAPAAPIQRNPKTDSVSSKATFIVECSPGLSDDLPRATEVYLGERFCVTRFLNQAKTYRQKAVRARAKGSRVYLSLPVIIPQNSLDEVMGVVLELLEDFDGVQGYDLGVLSRLAGKTRLTFFGLISSAQQVRILKEELQVSRIRPHPPAINLLRQLGEPDLFEIAVFGKIPIGANPRCLRKMLHNCDACGQIDQLRSEAGVMLADASTYRAAKDVSVLPHLDLLISYGFTRFVIDAFLRESEKVDTLIGRLEQGWRPSEDPANTTNGYFVNRGPSVLENLAWAGFFPKIERLL